MEGCSRKREANTRYARWLNKMNSEDYGTSHKGGKGIQKSEI